MVGACNPTSRRFAASGERKWGKAKKARFRDFVHKMSAQMFDVIHSNVTVRGSSWDEVSKDNDYSPKDPELKRVRQMETLIISF